MRSAVQTANLIRKRTRLRPALAIVLGSGFQGLLSQVHATETIPYNKLPGFPPVRVPGHQGKLIVGHLNGLPVVLLAGRAHFYEGHTLAEITFPVRVLAEFGVRHLLLTNAAGGINRRFSPGDLMLFRDHINFLGENPLRGPVRGGESPFIDLTRAYDASLCNLLKRAARRTGIRLRSGVYLAVSGPSYETPAEINAFARLGADAVGMSTVPEVIVARQCGLAVAAFSCITNPAAGRGEPSLSHDKVLREGQRAAKAAARLFNAFAREYARTLAKSA